MNGRSLERESGKWMVGEWSAKGKNGWSAEGQCWMMFRAWSYDVEKGGNMKSRHQKGSELGAIFTSAPPPCPHNIKSVSNHIWKWQKFSTVTSGRRIQVFFPFLGKNEMAEKLRCQVSKKRSFFRLSWWNDSRAFIWSAKRHYPTETHEVIAISIRARKFLIEWYQQKKLWRDKN